MIRLNKNIQQFIRYATVGLLNTGIDLGLLNLFIFWGWNVLIANTVAFIIAATNSFFLNKYWTYEDKHGNWKKQLPIYILIYGVGLAISNGFVYWFSIKLHWNVNEVKILSIAAIVAWNFLAPRFFVFKNQPPI